MLIRRYSPGIARRRAAGRRRRYATISVLTAHSADTLSRRVSGSGHPWVRDVTISNSTFGNRYVRLSAPHLGVHALGGGIGQGIAMGIGAAMAGVEAKTITLLGDGGSQLMLGELATAVESRPTWCSC